MTISLGQNTADCKEAFDILKTFPQRFDLQVSRKPLFRFLVWLALLILFASVWYLAEVVLLPRVVQAPSREAFLMGHCSPPHTRVDGAPINAMGFAGDVLDREKPAGVKRILTLGGSAFFNRDMADRLGQSLRGMSGSRLEVLGGALRVHNSRSSLHKFRYLSSYGLDYVLIYHGVNDLDANHVLPKYFSPDYTHLHPFFKRNFILDNSVAARVIYNRFLYKRPPTVLMGADYMAEPIFKDNLETLVDEIRASGGEPILMTFAWSIPPQYSLSSFQSGGVGYNNPDNYDSCPVEMWGTPAYVREGLDRHNAVTRKVAEQKKVRLIDQEELMGKSLEWFGDPVHLSEPGTQKFIQNTVDYFVAQKLL